MAKAEYTRVSALFTNPIVADTPKPVLTGGAAIRVLDAA